MVSRRGRNVCLKVMGEGFLEADPKDSRHSDSSNSRRLVSPEGSMCSQQIHGCQEEKREDEEELEDFGEFGDRSPMTPVRGSIEDSRSVEDELDDRDGEVDKEEDGDGDEEGDVEEGEEGRVAVGLLSPVEVSEKEREEHNLAHTPYRSWCKICVKNRGTNGQHRKQHKGEKEEENSKVRRICMDYFFIRGRRRDGR